MPHLRSCRNFLLVMPLMNISSSEKTVFSPIFLVVSKGNFPVDMSNSSMDPDIEIVSMPVRLCLSFPSFNILSNISRYCFIYTLNIAINFCRISTSGLLPEFPCRH